MAAESLAETLKETPLCAEHEKLGARMCRSPAGACPSNMTASKRSIFAPVATSDCSTFPIGEGFAVGAGPKSLESLQWMTTNDVAKLGAGQAQYSLFPNPGGGIVDDLIVYCVEPGRDYLLCVNASNVDKDFAFALENNRGAEIRNESEAWAQIAVQGPRAIELLQRTFSPDIARSKPLPPRNAVRRRSNDRRSDRIYGRGWRRNLRAGARPLSCGLSSSSRGGTSALGPSGWARAIRCERR